MDTSIINSLPIEDKSRQFAVDIEQTSIFSEDDPFNEKTQRQEQLEQLRRQAQENRKGNGRPSTDIAGQRFGSIVALAPVKDTTHTGLWLVQCDCGERIYITLSSLRDERGARHCGCRQGQSGTRGIREFSPIPRVPDWKIAFRSLYSNYRNSAIKRGYVWELIEEDVHCIMQRACTYCGIPPEQIHKSQSHEYTYNGIDRKDNVEGYTVANCVPCCGICNYAKGARSNKDFREWIERVYVFWITSS